MEIKSFKNRLFSQQDLTSEESMHLFELINTPINNSLNLQFKD